MVMTDKLPSAKQLAGNITFIYALMSSLWILFSDRLLALVTENPARLTQLQTVKGWAFVLLTSGLLYGLVYRGVRSLQASYRFLQVITEGTSDAIFIKDLEGRYLSINPAGARMLGKTIEEIVGKDDMDLLPPEIACQLRENDSHAIASGTTQVYEDVLPVAGQWRTYSTKKEVYRNAKGTPVGIIGIARDITERKQLLEALRREKEDLAALSAVTANSISTLELAELLEVLLQRVVSIMKADTAVIFLQTDGSLCVGASIGIERDVEAGYALALGEGFVGTIGATRQPLYIEDAQTDERVRSSLVKQHGIRSMLGVPLQRHGELVGVLHVDWLSIRPASDREIHLLEITAERCTMAILNAQLYTQTKQLQERLQLQIDRMPIGCIVNNAQLRLTDWNPAAEKIFGFTKGEVLGQESCQLINPPSLRSRVREIYQQLVAGEMTVRSVHENLTKSGQTITCEWFNTPLKEADGTVIGMLSMVQDITERTQAEQELRRKEELYRTLARNFPNGAVFLFDRELRFTIAEGSEITEAGLDSAFFEGKTIWETLSPDISEALAPAYRQALGGGATTLELPYNDKIYLVQVLPVTHSNGEIYAGMAVTQDVTERKRAEEQLRRYAFTDLLTGLPNRAYFLERLAKKLRRSKRRKVGTFAVLLLELERFETIKYSLGHYAADQLTIAAARRLEACLRPTDIIARLESDEFAILLRNLKNLEEATHIAERIYQQFTLPFDLEGREVFSTASIGIALCNRGDTTHLPEQERPEDFLRAADTAKHHAKIQERARYAVFNPAMYEQAVTRFQLETDLRRAIDRQQFQVYYQPIISLTTGRISGFEALVRWTHPTRGRVSPGEFIPLAEETGLISHIDRWVLREACIQLVTWQQTVADSLTMSVNLSGVQLAQLGFLERLDQILQETGVEGSCVKLEITESGLLSNASSEMVLLQQLKTLGIQLSIDDFGTGYSSLERLHQLPIDTLKIDRSFVNQMDNDEESWEIVRTIVTLAHSLKMDVIAEGIETAQQLTQLRSLQCESGQGYFFSPPVNCEEATQLLAAQLEW